MSPTVPRLKRRAEFLKVARSGQRWAQPGLVLQALDRRDENADGPRAGFTVTKKSGNAVQRNRARRRLKAAAELVLGTQGQPGHDYVLIGRRDTIARGFRELTADLEAALAQLAAGRGRPNRRPRKSPKGLVK